MLFPEDLLPGKYTYDGSAQSKSQFTSLFTKNPWGSPRSSSSPEPYSSSNIDPMPQWAVSHLHERGWWEGALELCVVSLHSWYMVWYEICIGEMCFCQFCSGHLFIWCLNHMCLSNYALEQQGRDQWGEGVRIKGELAEEEAATMEERQKDRST